jgi:erythronate-4-phosphate dehydrogenase
VVPYLTGELRDEPDRFTAIEVLVCRSATRLDDRLLSALPRLVAVASPVIGTDHVDFDALDAFRERRGRPVPFFHAPGATAGGVADQAFASLCAAADRLGRNPATLGVGIWGFGNCGKALAARLDRLGARWVAYDPPLAERDGAGFRSCTVEDVLSCDAVSLHVPLTLPGRTRWPTRHLFDAGMISRLGRNAPAGYRILVNTSRGAVVDGQALAAELRSGSALVAALDVWENEPRPGAELVEAAFLSTPHTAGSVVEGKVRAVARIATALAGFLSRPFAVPAAGPVGGLRVPPGPLSGPGIARIRDAVGVERVSAAFKTAYRNASEAEQGRAFEQVRQAADRHEVIWD